MTDVFNRLIEVMNFQKECSLRSCNHDCSSCDLYVSQEELLISYDRVVNILRYLSKEVE